MPPTISDFKASFERFFVNSCIILAKIAAHSAEAIKHNKGINMRILTPVLLNYV